MAEEFSSSCIGPQPEAKSKNRLASPYEFKSLYQVLVLQAPSPARVVEPCVYIQPRELPEGQRWLARMPPQTSLSCGVAA